MICTAQAGNTGIMVFKEIGMKSNYVKKKKNKSKGLIIALVSVLILALGAGAAYIIITNEQNDRIMKNTTALEGVTVNGISISGMSEDEAREATSSIPADLLSAIQISFTADGQSFSYSGEELGVATDYEDVLKEAMAFGNTGSLEERKQAIEQAKTQGVSFAVATSPDRDKITAVLLPLKDSLDKPAVDAACTFTPWGHTADGTAYEQDQQAMIEATASGKMWDRPELARVPDAETPNKLRYKFWNNDKYVDDYKPEDTSISRFVYTDGTDGLSVDMDSVINDVFSQIESGSYSEITAPEEAIKPAVSVDDLKKNTQLIASWTSSYSRHAGYNRNWNVAKLSGIVNGVQIQPDEVWSINDTAGVRTLSGGWQAASGIVDGGYVDQPGGGVCQISSTTYNAAIRAALDIKDATHHSIPSDYIPFGLDATISSGSPDLKIRNPYSTPVYLISYVDPVKKTATVEVYGPIVDDPDYGQVIRDFSFEDLGTFGELTMNTIYNSTTARDGTVLAQGQVYEYAKARLGRKVKTYIHYISLDGKEVAVKDFQSKTWNPIPGTTYVNGPDPATLPPVTDPAVSETPADTGTPAT